MAGELFECSLTVGMAMQAAPVTQTLKSKKKSKREQEEAAIQQARQAAEAAALAGVSVQVSGPSVLLIPCQAGCPHSRPGRCQRTGAGHSAL